MSKLLYTNGCSWTAGNGLESDPVLAQRLIHESNDDVFRYAWLAKHIYRYAWPSQLAESLGCGLLNHSMGGGSNARILRTTSDYLMTVPKECRKDLLVIIGWTTSERNEIYVSVDGELSGSGWYLFNARQPFSEFQITNKLTPECVKEINEYQKTYLTRMYSHKINLMYYFQQKFLLSNLLENLGIKFLFFDSLPAFWHPTTEDTAEFELAIDRIKTPNWITDIFQLYLHDRNIELGPCSHPTSIGHKIWANYLHSKLTEIYGNEVWKTQ